MNLITITYSVFLKIPKFRGQYTYSILRLSHLLPFESQLQAEYKKNKRPFFQRPWVVYRQWAALHSDSHPQGHRKSYWSPPPFPLKPASS